jgi:hypothetical protein
MEKMRKANVFLVLGFLMIFFVLFDCMVTPSFAAVPPYMVPDAYVYADQTDGTGYGSDYTNGTGQYVIDSGIKVGNYTVTASADGYLSGSSNTTVESTSDTKVVDIYLNRSAIIWGKVVGDNGKPVVGADVSLRKNSTGQYVAIETTDSDGKYCFATDVDTGAYYVLVDEFAFPSPLYSHMYAPYLATGYISGNRSATVSVTAGATAMASDIVLNMSGVITGTVIDDQGSPMSNVAVTATNLDTYSSQTVSTNASGVYLISYEIVTGTYSLEPSVFGYVADSVDVAAIQGATAVQNLTMVKSATVHGTVLRKGDNKPVPGTSLSFASQPYKYYGGGYTDNSGNYRIQTGLGPATYSVFVYLQGEMVNTTEITLGAGENATLNFWIDAYFISGIVYENVTGGQRVHYPDVSLAFQDGFLPPPGGSAEGDVNGTYEMVVPVREGTVGPCNGTFTVSASGYNTTKVNATLTIGTDSTMDFVLFKKPPSPPPPSAKIIGTIYGYAGPSLPFSHQVWFVPSDNYTFFVELNTTSKISYLYGSVASGTISIYVWGPEGTTGWMTIMIPKDLFPGPTFTITSYPGPDPTQTLLTSNATYWIIGIQYTHSSKYITFQSENIVPEYTGPAILIAMMMTGTAVILLEKKRKMRTLR